MIANTRLCRADSRPAPGFVLAYMNQKCKKLGSQAFYQAVFGYEVGGIGEYPPPAPGQAPAAWMTYFAVTDTDAAVAKVNELGGHVVQPSFDSPYGRISVVADDHGAVFSVIAPPAG
jgi:predicted enzyme related to lactoylglutathione lyase